MSWHDLEFLPAGILYDFLLSITAVIVSRLVESLRRAGLSLFCKNWTFQMKQNSSVLLIKIIFMILCMSKGFQTYITSKRSESRLSNCFLNVFSKSINSPSPMNKVEPWYSYYNWNSSQYIFIFIELFVIGVRNYLCFLCNSFSYP